MLTARTTLTGWPWPSWQSRRPRTATPRSCARRPWPACRCGASTPLTCEVACRVPRGLAAHAPRAVCHMPHRQPESRGWQGVGVRRRSSPSQFVRARRLEYCTGVITTPCRMHLDDGRGGLLLRAPCPPTHPLTRSSAMEDANVHVCSGMCGRAGQSHAAPAASLTRLVRCPLARVQATLAAGPIASMCEEDSLPP